MGNVACEAFLEKRIDVVNATLSVFVTARRLSDEFQNQIRMNLLQEDHVVPVKVFLPDLMIKFWIW
jgi:hypothetical protein